MDKDVNIRPIKREDLSAVCEIERLSFEDPYPQSLIGNLYGWNSDTSFVAEMEGKIVGYVMASTSRSMGHLISIAVIPSHRGRGIGGRLVSVLLQLFRDMDIPSIFLEVRSSNRAARIFYEGIGFKLERTIPRYYGNEDAIIYLKDI